MGYGLAPPLRAVPHPERAKATEGPIARSPQPPYNSLMPPHSLDVFFRSLNKGELAPVYYLYGAEDVLKDEAVKAIVDRALEIGRASCRERVFITV